MIKLWAFSLLALIIGTCIGLGLWQDPGYLLIAYGGYSIEMPLWVGAIAFLVFLTVWNFLGDLVRFSTGFSEKIRSLKHTKQEKRARRVLKHVILFLENKELKVLAPMVQEALPLLEALSGRSTEETLLNKLLVARLALSQGKIEVARSQLASLEERFPKNPYVLIALKELAMLSQDQALLVRILPKLYNYAELPEAVLVQIHSGLVFRQLATLGSVEVLEAFWKGVPKGLRKEPAVAGAYAKALKRLKQDITAEKWLRALLEASWQPELVQIYADLSCDPQKRLAFLEKLLKKHEKYAQEGALWKALGSLAKQNGLWGQSLRYYEQAQNLAPTGDACWELAQLCELLKKPEEAFGYYQKGLALVIGKE